MQTHICCAKCGAPLRAMEIVVASRFNLPGACKEHQFVVLEEALKDVPFWPQGWHGDWNKTPNNKWRCSLDKERD